MRISSLVLALGAALSSGGAAQTPPHTLIETFGPDGWRVRLGPTNLGSMLASDKGRALWQPQIEPFLATWREISGGEATFRAHRKLLLDYGGPIRVGIWEDADGEEPLGCVAAVFGPDGHTNAEALRKGLREMLYEALPGRWEVVDLDGSGREVRRSADFEVTAPVAFGDELLVVAAYGGDLTHAFALGRSLLGKPHPRPDSPALTMRIRFGRLVALAMTDDDEDVLRAIGFDTLGPGTFSLGTAGPRLRIDYAQEFTADERGLFGVLMPSAPGVPTLLAAVPPDASGTWIAGHFDLQRLYDTVLAAIEASFPDENPRKEVAEELGLDLGADVLAHLSDEAMLSFGACADLFDRFDDLPWVLTFRLRDEAAFRDGLHALLPRFRPFFSRERTEKHDDVELHRYGNALGYDLWLAVGRGVFVIGGGRGVEEHVADMLDRCANLPESLPPELDPPELFLPVRRYLLPGTHGYAAGRSGSLVRLATGLWTSGFDELGLLPFRWFRPTDSTVDPDAAPERAEQLAALLEAHNLDRAQSATSWHERTWAWRLFW